MYCSVCGNIIEKGKGKYCSTECRNKALFNKSVGELTKDVIINALSKSNNINDAAFLLERSRSTLTRAIKRLCINPENYLIKTKKSYNIDVVVKTLLSNRNYTKTGKIFGVSDNAIRKRLKLNNLPTDLSDLEKIYNERLNI
jgi:Fe-S-cluster-containing dehydrogenase component